MTPTSYQDKVSKKHGHNTTWTFALQTTYYPDLKTYNCSFIITELKSWNIRMGN